MAKLLPPIVENITPAFYSKNGMVLITIPFFMNRAVNSDNISGIAVKIKSVQSNISLYETFTTEFNIEGSGGHAILKISQNSDETKAIVSKLKVGQFYKFQIAYMDLSGEIGYYSNATTSKYTTYPTLSIIGLDINTISPRAYTYSGLYSQKNKDITEALHSYELRVYDSKNSLVYRSGEKLYNNDNVNSIDESVINFDLDIELEENETYFLAYNVKTVNGLEASSFDYRIIERPTLDAEIQAKVKMSLDQENGCVQIDLVADKDKNGNEYPATGSFVLTRACFDKNPLEGARTSVWNQLITVNFINEVPTQVLFKDFTVEQGKWYQYSLQQFNCRNLYSNRMFATQEDGSEIVRVDFEHAFLTDGKRQLKIKYNPRVSSLKENILESKVDTLGGQYPFIFKNGNVDYKEFAISGLISLLSDENGYFMESSFAAQTRPGTPANQSAAYCEPTENPTFQTMDNYYNERNFKMEVLAWLNNGEPKLFRSPSEGNYIVRLMNTSLSPHDQLGRMLHTFNTTAYEIASLTYQNLISHKFLNVIDNYTTKVLSWKTIVIDKNTPLNINLLEDDIIYSLDCYDMAYGDQLKITLTDGTEVPVFIGTTGQYRVNLEVPIKSVQLIKRYRFKSIGGKEEVPEETSYITYSFYTSVNSEFKHVKDINYINIPLTQIIGDHSIPVLQKLGFVLKITEKGKTKYVLNPKMELLKIYRLSATRRPWKPLYVTAKDSDKVLQDYWINPWTKTPLIRPDSSVLYRSVNCDIDLDGEPSITWAEYVNGPSENSYLENYQGGRFKQYAYLDFHKNYYSATEFPSEDGNEVSLIAGTIEMTPYSSYEPYFNILDIKDGKTTKTKIDLGIREDGSNSYPHFQTNNFNNIEFEVDSEIFNELVSYTDFEVKNGVIFELGYFARNIDYLIEDTISDTKYQKALKELNNYLRYGGLAITNNSGLDPNSDIYYQLLNEVSVQYHDYCVKVYKALRDIYEKEKEVAVE